MTFAGEREVASEKRQRNERANCEPRPHHWGRTRGGDWARKADKRTTRRCTTKLPTRATRREISASHFGVRHPQATSLGAKHPGQTRGGVILERPNPFPALHSYLGPCARDLGEVVLLQDGKRTMSSGSVAQCGSCGWESEDRTGALVQTTAHHASCTCLAWV